MAVSCLYHHFGRDFLRFQVPFLQRLEAGKLKPLLNAVDRRLNSPLTSSCGRLFDAVAALAGIRQQVNYEAQAAIELEMAIDAAPGLPPYELDIAEQSGELILGTRPLFTELLADLGRGTPAGAISARFHLGLIESLARAAEILRHGTQLDRVCLSGGSFHNRFLLEQLQARLHARGFQVFTHSQVPAGDGGLSLGQAMVAAHRFASGEGTRNR
jgi:hydrogenase maturation protein HypF